MRKNDAQPANTESAAVPPRFLRLPDVERATGLRHSQIWALEKHHNFPARVKISTRAAGWIEAEVYDWIRNRIAASREAA